MNTEQNPVGWFEIYVEDMDRARKFYEETFQTTLEKLPVPDIEMWAFPMDPDKPGAGGSLVKMKDKDSGGGGTIVYFSCVDCGEEYSRAMEAGGKSHFEKMSIGEYGFIALVYDTESNLIGLHSMK